MERGRAWRVTGVSTIDNARKSAASYRRAARDADTKKGAGKVEFGVTERRARVTSHETPTTTGGEGEGLEKARVVGLALVGGANSFLPGLEQGSRSGARGVIRLEVESRAAASTREARHPIAYPCSSPSRRVCPCCCSTQALPPRNRKSRVLPPRAENSLSMDPRVALVGPEMADDCVNKMSQRACMPLSGLPLCASLRRPDMALGNVWRMAGPGALHILC